MGYNKKSTDRSCSFVSFGHQICRMRGADMAKKVYAVRKGRAPGLYDTWEACRQQITGYSGAEYKGFASREEAKRYLDGEGPGTEGSDTEAAAYVDGSYLEATGQFSCGVVFFHGGQEEQYSRLFEDQELAGMRNVAGEIKGAETAMRFCLERGIRSLTIYYDYEGIEKWCTGEWEARKPGTIRYREFYEDVSRQVEIHFVKVKGHSHNQYNDLADQLAREAFAPSDEKGIKAE